MSSLIKKLLIATLGLIAIVVVIVAFFSEEIPQLTNQPANALERARMNYSEEVSRIAEERDLPYEYLMALIVLECSGNRPPGTRFEPHVYDKLVQVRKGERRKFENIRQDNIQNATDEALKNLATSWGPFQLMGYKCIGLEVNVRDIRGDESVYYGVKWIEEEYGNLLRKGKFKDAFHFHNTGRKYPVVGGPRTHDPEYCDKGVAFMAYFRE